jgi:hypothetical protein
VSKCYDDRYYVYYSPANPEVTVPSVGSFSIMSHDDGFDEVVANLRVNESVSRLVRFYLGTVGGPTIFPCADGEGSFAVSPAQFQCFTGKVSIVLGGVPETARSFFEAHVSRRG